MEVIPAIDLRGGKCVRLYKGDFNKETVYSDRPADIAAQWVAMGASRLHIVDLDGAKAGVPVNLESTKSIASRVAIPIQAGGGIRTIGTAREVLALGVQRVILGTAVYNNPTLVGEACREFGRDAVIVSIDAVEGRVMGGGWLQSTSILATDLLKQLAEEGLSRFIYTDITRDGTLTGPNYRAIDGMSGLTNLKMIVAGGISSIDHLLKLSSHGVEAAIVGKAIYSGDIDLREAIQRVSSSN